MSSPPAAEPTVIEAAPIEIDPEHIPAGDNDSSLGDFTDELNSFTTSLSPSVTNYPTEFGRRYHAFRPGAYMLPNDEAELERLDVAHYAMKKATGDKLHLTPLPPGFQKVLDIGTGTGIWAIEMGETYPQADILGNDLSPTQPAWVPPNVKFEVDDVESDWTYDTPFDFIFCRYMCSSISDWTKLVKRAYDNVKPGGFAEFQDWNLLYHSDDGTLLESSSTLKWLNALLGAASNRGREPNPGPLLEGWFKEAGFQNIVHQKFKLPIGPWAKDKYQKEVGLFNLVQVLDGLEGFSFRLLTGIGWRPEEVEVLCAKVRSELKSKAIHAILDFHVVYGQKPEA